VRVADLVLEATVARAVVACEEDAWALLEKSLREDAFEDGRVDLVRWPVLKLKVEPGDGWGTPEINRALVRLQKAIYCGFALLKYGAADTRRLTRQDRYVIGFKYTITSGSTVVSVDLSGVLREFAREVGKNTRGSHVVAMVLGLGLMFSSPSLLSAWLSHTAEVHRAKLQVEAQGQLVALIRETSETHAKQLGLMKEVYDRSEVVRFAWHDSVPWRPPLMSVAPHRGTITFNDVQIDGDVAKKVAKAATKAAKEDRKRVASKQPPIIEAQWVTTVTPTSTPSLPPPMRLGRNAST
jgi:hypothetical protein